MVSLEDSFHTSKLMRVKTLLMYVKIIRYVSISLNSALKRNKMQKTLLSSIFLKENDETKRFTNE